MYSDLCHFPLLVVNSVGCPEGGVGSRSLARMSSCVTQPTGTDKLTRDCLTLCLIDLIQWILWSVAVYCSFCIVQLPFSDYICKSARLDGCAQDKSPEEQNGSQRQRTFLCGTIPSSWLLTQFSQRASVALSQGSTDTARLKHKSPQRHQPMLMRLKQKYNELRHSQTWGELMLRLHSGSG